MDLKISLIVAFSCILNINFVLSNDSDRTINVSTTSILAQQGSVKNLVCRYNGSPSNIIRFSDKINWIHRKYGSGDETYITRNSDLAEGADAKKYAAKATVEETYILFQVTVNDVQPSDDGYFVCELIVGQSTKKMEQMVNFTVISPVEKLSLTIRKSNNPNSHDNVMSNATGMVKSKRLQLDEGKYDIECTASGSNPPPEVTLNENGVAIGQGVKSTTSLVQQGKRLYQTTASKTQITINKNSKDKRYGCMGVNPKAINAKKSISAEFRIIDVNTKVAVVECKNASAILGDKKRAFTCYVKVDKGKIKCSDIVWIKESAAPGSEKTYNHDDKYVGVTLECRNVSATVWESKLIISEVGQQLFDETYTMVFNNPSYGTVTKGNQMTQYSSGAEYMGGCISLIACLIIAIIRTYL